MKMRLLFVLTILLVFLLLSDGTVITKKKVASHRRERSLEILDVEKVRLWRTIQTFGSPTDILAAVNEKHVVNKTEGILISCDDCNPESVEECPVSGSLLWVQDTETYPGDPERALHSLPPGFVVKTSGLPGAGLGVWTLQDIPACTLFGPYGGELIIAAKKSQQFASYAWKVTVHGNPKLMIDAENKAKSNWLRYINCPDFEYRQNLVPIEFEGEIFYKTFSKIPAGTELLVWYGDNFGNRLRNKKIKDPRIIYS